MSQHIVGSVFRSLRPTFEDMVEDVMFDHWTDYGSHLDDLEWVYDEDGVLELIEVINDTLSSLLSTNPKHEAAYDVASTLESLIPDQFAGKFKY